MTVDIKKVGTDPLMEPHLFSDTMYSICPEGTLKLLEQNSSHQILTKDEPLSYISKIYKEKMHELIHSNEPTESFRIAIESQNVLLLKNLLKTRLPEIDFENVFNDLVNPWAIQFMIDPANKVPLNVFYITIRLVTSDNKEIIKAILKSPGAEERFEVLRLWSVGQEHCEIIEQNLELFSFDQADNRFLTKAVDYKCFGIVQKIMDSKAVRAVNLNHYEYKIETDTLDYGVTKCLESGQQDLVHRIQTVVKNRNKLCYKIYNAASSNLYATAGICLGGVVILGRSTGLLPDYADYILSFASLILVARN